MKYINIIKNMNIYVILILIVCLDSLQEIYLTKKIKNNELYLIQPYPKVFKTLEKG